MTTSLERVLAETLKAVERAAPGPSVDLVEVVHEGLRRRRRRHVVVASTAAAVALVVVPTAVVLPSTSSQKGVAVAPSGVATSPTANPTTVVTGSCTVGELAVPSSMAGQAQFVEANDVDPTGRYVAGYVQDALSAGRTPEMAVLWVDRQPHPLGKNAEAIAVNATGDVVGSDTAGSGGWVYRGGRRTTLPALPGNGHTTPTAINSRGDIVGESNGRAVIWPANQPGHVRAVGTADAKISGISDNGLIVGVDGNNDARLWNRDGTVHALPAGFPYRPQMVAGAWVLGAADGTGPVGYRYALWNMTTGAIVALAADTTATGFEATALSASGAVLGYVVGTDHRIRPAIFRDGKAVLLPLPEGHSDDVETAAVSADGRTIVGTDGRTDAGTYQTQALLWHC